ncbi:MAG TPA: deoxyribodipyrimidine photo-lyase [Kofleriaceae bacterium]
MRTIVWFRGKDLRVADHAPLHDAIAGGEVIPLFVLDPYFFAPARARELPHRIQFLLESLSELAEAIAARGSKLVVVRGKSTEVVPRLAKTWRADRVVAHRWVEPIGRERDRRVAEALAIPFELYEGETLVPPGTLRTKSGTPYRVFSQFAHAHARADHGHPPLPAPRTLPALPVRAATVAIPTIDELGIARNPRLVEAGERAAHRRLAAFRRIAAKYPTGRDRMDLPLTSRLSQDLKFGTLTARQVWHAIDGAVYRNELVWREFAHSTLWDVPALLDEPFQARWNGFPWRTDADADWRAWTEGRTGYPVVDAAARQLLAEGFVHNRARMIAASFLAKHLLVDFRRGEAHYLRYLTDGDWAQNDMGWQWSAGCGCDAQPYFRVFNPMLQGEKLDPDGAYVKRWVPELAAVPARFVHAPWTAPVPPAGYPAPIVDHAAARERFLSIAKAHLKR